MRMNIAVKTASPYNQPDIPFAFSMIVAIPSTVWLRLSTMPFCWVVYGVVR